MPLRSRRLPSRTAIAHSLSNETLSRADGLLGKHSHTHTSTQTDLRELCSRHLYTQLKCWVKAGTQALNQAVLVFIAVLNLIPCSRSEVVNCHCRNAMVMSSRRNPSVWLGLGRFGWGRGETVGGIGRLVSGGLSNRHSVDESSPLQHTQTYTISLHCYCSFSFFLSHSLSHLVISWSETFPWRTIAVEMDYDYKGEVVGWQHTYTEQH